ncbi:hypothetical protein C8Q77DRAFT_379139 [Trametes polyzona]|nr:hypothetical protein C8Q77DRAFT_379139 [Trametes polyzona]
MITYSDIMYTALAWAYIHGLLGTGWTPTLLRRLLRNKARERILSGVHRLLLAERLASVEGAWVLGRPSPTDCYVFSVASQVTVLRRLCAIYHVMRMGNLLTARTKTMQRILPLPSPTACIDQSRRSLVVVLYIQCRLRRAHPCDGDDLSDSADVHAALRFRAHSVPGDDADDEGESAPGSRICQIQRFPRCCAQVRVRCGSVQTIGGHMRCPWNA